MPDLGKYADAVLSSYAVSIVLIIGLVALSILRAGKIQKQLALVEERSVRAKAP
ncbi:MAG: heme exporter protein CcmD [Litoreibacter sp.]